MIRFIVAIALLAPAGCAAPPAPSQAVEADASACTAQADAVYDNQNVDALSRTSQNGLYFAPTPDHVFDGQRQGDLNQRDLSILSCESKGDSNSASGAGYAAPLVKPRIITSP